MRFQWLGLMLGVWGFCATLWAAEPQPAPAPWPEQTLAVLTLRQQGASFDRLVEWCGRIVANSGAIVKQTVTSAVFPIPVNEGVDPNGPAAVLLLDTQPDLTQGLGEQAFVLAVSDAKALREAVRAVFGGEEKDGVLSASIPQGFDKPERKLAIKIEDKWAWIAPDEALLKKLVAAAGGRGAAAFLDAGATEAALKVNLKLLREKHQTEFQKLLAAAQAMSGSLAPQAVGSVEALRAGALARAQELETLELAIGFEGEALDFSAQLKALPGTALFNVWSREPGKAPALQHTVPAGALTLQARAPVLAQREPRAGEPAEAPPAGSGTQGAVLSALLKLRELADGGASVTLADAGSGGAQLIAALGTSQPDRAAVAVQDALQAIVVFSCELARPLMHLKEGAPAPFELKPLPEQEVHGVKVRGFQIAMTAGYKLLPELEQVYQRSMDWPLSVRFAVVKDGLLLAAGKQHDAAMLASLQKNAAGSGTAQAQADALDTSVRPVGVLKMLLNAVLDPAIVEAAQFTERLEDAPIGIGAGSSAGAGRFRLRLPSKAVKAVMDLYLRLDRANIDPFQLSLPRAEPGAPPPPPAP